MRNRFRNHLLIVGMLTMVFVPAGVAHASCLELPAVPVAIADAQTVFVGTVTSAEYLDRVATFQVEEVWKGDVGSTVVVNGGPSIKELEAGKAVGQDIVTSVDRSFVVGSRYLVVSHGSEDGVLLDNQCSVTQVYNADLDEHRPDTAVIVAQPGDPTPGTTAAVDWVLIAGIGILTIGLGAGAALVLRNRQDGVTTGDGIRASNP